MKTQFTLLGRVITVAIRRPDTFYRLQRTVYDFPVVFAKVHCLWFNLSWLTIMSFRHVAYSSAVSDAIHTYAKQTNEELAS